jgi:signal transduction histidine kinase
MDDDIKDRVRCVLDAEDNYNLLFVGPPASGDQLKNEFINIAAHELCAPIQPILGMAELLQRRISGSAVAGSKREIEMLDTIIRNAKKHVGYDKNRRQVSKACTAFTSGFDIGL